MCETWVNFTRSIDGAVVEIFTYYIVLCFDLEHVTSLKKYIRQQSCSSIQVLKKWT